VSRDDPGWNGRRGRVTAYVDEALGGASGQVAYICGQPDMVTDLRRVLAEEGIGDERQSYERY
jgi:NAD(P)H-flavin reductase